jgi:hypothetical protein
MFDSNSQVAIPYETHFAARMGHHRARYERTTGFDRTRFLDDLVASEVVKSWDLTREIVADALEASRPANLPDALRDVYSIYARRNGKERYGEKCPGYVMHIPVLAELFPEARFVHLIRDGRDVTLSYKQAGWGPKDVAESAYYWKRFVERGRSTGRALGDGRYREVHYEELVADPERIVKELCDFLDVTFEDEMLQYYERADAVLDKVRGGTWATGHKNIFKPPTKGLRDWRTQMSRQDVEVFEALAGDLLADLGYERTVRSLTASVRTRAGIGWTRVQGRRATRFAKDNLPRVFSPAAS